MIRLGQHIHYIDWKGAQKDALVVQTFEDNGSEPRVTVVYVKPGQQGMTTKSFIPHESRMTERDKEGFWRYAVANDTKAEVASA